MSDESVETLAVQIQGITSVEPRFQTLLIKNYHLPLELSNQICDYPINAGDTVVVLGTSSVAANPKQKLSELQIQTITSSIPSKHPIGISNGLNFCYLISAIQMLFASKQSRERVKQFQVAVPFQQKLKDIFESLENKTECKVAALGVEFAKQFQQFGDIKVQYDAQEALQVLQAELHMEDLYTVQTDKEKHQFLQLGIKPEFQAVNDAVGAFLGEEKIIQLPKLLQLQFLRYQFDPETKKTQKLSRKLAFTFKMDLNDFLAEGVVPKTYTLKAIIAHQGVAADQGHYVCFTRHGKKWFLFDDAGAQICEEEQVFALAGGSATGFLGYVALYIMEE